MNHRDALWALLHTTVTAIITQSGPELPDIILLPTKYLPFALSSVDVRAENCSRSGVVRWHKSPEWATADKSYLAESWGATSIADEMSRRSVPEKEKVLILFLSQSASFFSLFAPIAPKGGTIARIWTLWLLRWWPIVWLVLQADPFFSPLKRSQRGLKIRAETNGGLGRFQFSAGLSVGDRGAMRFLLKPFRFISTSQSP